MMPSRRFLLPLSAFGLLLGGCAKHETAVESGARAQILHVGNKDEPADLDPHTNNGATTGTILTSLFEGLVIYGGDGKSILPGVAESWDISPDGLTYTFHLRSNAKWSNGDPVTAQDFRDSFLRVLDPALGCEQANQAFPIVGAQDFLEGRSKDPNAVGVRAPDARTFITILRRPAPYWLATLAQNGPLWPVNLRSVDAAGGWNKRGGAWTRAGQMIGNGPFVLAEWRPNAFIRVVRNPFYWDATHVRLNEIYFYPTDDEAAEERAFRAGQLHVTYRLPESKVASYEHDNPGELQIAPDLRTFYLTFNVAKSPFTDVRVRRAFSLAVNREQLVKATLGLARDSPRRRWSAPAPAATRAQRNRLRSRGGAPPAGRGGVPRRRRPAHGRIHPERQCRRHAAGRRGVASHVGSKSRRACDGVAVRVQGLPQHPARKTVHASARQLGLWHRRPARPARARHHRRPEQRLRLEQPRVRCRLRCG